MTSFYTENELKALGLAHCGKNVLISRKCSIYGADRISVGDNTRIDDFCILSGNVTIGRHVHISAYTALYGGKSGEGIAIMDYVAVSSRCAVYAESDDYSGLGMANPTIPDEFRNVYGEPVILQKHVLVGSGCTILPGVTIGEGSSVGSMSLVSKSLEPWGMYVGIPCRRIKERSQHLLELEAQFLKSKEAGN